MNSKPWYKGRLPYKYLTKTEDGLKFPTCLNTRNGMFDKEGLDDFRNGCPPCTEIVTWRPKEGFLPLIDEKPPGSAPETFSKKPSKCSTLFSKLSSPQQARKAFVEEKEATWRPKEGFLPLIDEKPPGSAPETFSKKPSKCSTLFSKLSSPQQARKAFVEEKEATWRPKEGFLPLIDEKPPGSASETYSKKPSKCSNLFSKLSSPQQARKAFVEEKEASVKAHPLACCANLEEQILADVLQEVLEVRDPDKQLEDTCSYFRDGKKRVKKCKGILNNRSVRASLNVPKPAPVPNPDDWLEEISCIEDFPEVPPFQRHLSKKASSYYKWAASSGCEEMNEDYLRQKYDFYSDVKPQFGPARMKNILEVPEEVMFSKRVVKPKEPDFSIPEPNFEKKLKELNIYPPNKHMRMRSLPPKLWEKLREDEPLLDLNAPCDSEDGFRRFEKGPNILEELHGTLAFKSFILNKGYSMPGLIERLFTRKKWGYDTHRTPTNLSTRNPSTENPSEEE
ncbi:protein FAM47E-like [Rhynchocyon petersi]